MQQILRICLSPWRDLALWACRQFRVRPCNFVASSKSLEAFRREKIVMHLPIMTARRTRRMPVSLWLPVQARGAKLPGRTPKRVPGAGKSGGREPVVGVASHSSAPRHKSMAPGGFGTLWHMGWPCQRKHKCRYAFHPLAVELWEILK